MSSNTGSLSAFLALNRARYLDALRENRGRDWTVVVGNEAGDLDSSASSIAYAYLTSTFHNRPTIALIQTPRTDLRLRAENLYAYEMCQMLPEADLLCIDDIPEELLPRVSTSTFALVDHNSLTSRFLTSPFTTPPTVVAIIDHHDDEGFYLQANPRIIKVPVGSCASLVAEYFTNSWNSSEHVPPPELATLLLSAIFIDTGGLKPGGKAVPIDHEAATLLFPMSTFTSPPSSELTSQSFSDNNDVAVFIDVLAERKQSVSHLSVRDLLRRDYKEYSFQSSSRITKVGLATVPQTPKKWFDKESFINTWAAIDAWMDERTLDVLGVLYTYSRKGRHERQELWVVKYGSGDIKKKLFEGLEASEELRLEPKHVEKGLSKHDKLVRKGVDNGLIDDFITPAGSMARIWLQGNAKATRKVVAPRVKELLESL